MVSVSTMASMKQLSNQTTLLHNPSSSRTCCLPASSALCIGLHRASPSIGQLESSRLATSARTHQSVKLPFSVQRPATFSERRRRGSVRSSGVAKVIETEKPLDLPTFPLSLLVLPRRSANSNFRKTVLRNNAVYSGGALRRLAEILLGSALLVATLGLGFTRPALAHPSTTETSSNVQNEELHADETTLSETSLESKGTPESKKVEARDPAELVLLSYLERHPQDVKALEGLMYVRLRKGSMATALETVDKLLALRPDHAPWQLIRAQALEFLGDLDEARRAFELILEKDPLSARALQGLATVMSKSGEGTEMLEMLRRAVQTAVETGKIREAKNLRMLLGQMFTLEGNLQEALAQYQELEREDPRDFRPYLCQGLVYSLLNQKADADRAFRKYRNRCPKSFPERGYLDDLMIGAKTEARKLQTGERLQPPGKKKSKPLKQPSIDTAVAESFDE